MHMVWAKLDCLKANIEQAGFLFEKSTAQFTNGSVRENLSAVFRRELKMEVTSADAVVVVVNGYINSSINF